jgi:hypothetical protein
MRCLTNLLLVAVLLTPSVVFCTGKVERQSLTGLPAIRVIVEEMGQELDAAGITANQVRVDSELRLRKSGVRVTDAEDAPYLYISVNGIKAGESVWALSIEVSLWQDVRLSRNNAWSMGATWNKGQVAVFSMDRIRNAREHVSDCVDAFINDYLAANPSVTR